MSGITTSKVVVGVALAAVFGTVFYVYGVRGKPYVPPSETAATAAPQAAIANPAPGDAMTAASAPASATPPADQPAVANTASAPTPAAPPAAVAQSNGATPEASDSRIAADVKTQIAAVTPNTNIKVTASDGVVALAGSVPDKHAAEQARQAAMQVDGVKSVDTSQLMVNNPSQNNDAPVL